MGMGDMDNDKHIDLITTNKNQNSFTVHYFVPATNTYSASQSVFVDKLNPNAQIASIIPSKEITELQSLYVVYWKNFAVDQTLTLKVFQQVRQGLFQEYTTSAVNGLQMAASTQPFFFDINGDMKQDLMFTNTQN